MSGAWLVWSSLFSLVGFAVFVYGRRQRQMTAILVGVALMVYPYFISNLWLLVGTGVVLIAGLFFGSRWEGS